MELLFVVVGVLNPCQVIKLKKERALFFKFQEADNYPKLNNYFQNT